MQVRSRQHCLQSASISPGGLSALRGCLCIADPAVPEAPAPEEGSEVLPPLPPSEPLPGQGDIRHRHKHKRKHRDQGMSQEDLPASRRSRPYEGPEPAMPAAHSNGQPAAAMTAAGNNQAEVRGKDRDAGSTKDKDTHQHRSERKHKFRDAEADVPSMQAADRPRDRDLHRHKDRESSRRHRDEDKHERHKSSKGRDKAEDRGSRRHRHDDGRDDRSRR